MSFLVPVRFTCFIAVAAIFALPLFAGPVWATDCPPGGYSDCVAVVSSPWNPLVPVIGAVAGAGVAGLVAGRRSKPIVLPERQPPLQVEAPSQPTIATSVPASGSDVIPLPEEPVRTTLVPEGPPPLPAAPPPEMRATSNLIPGDDGTLVNVPTDTRSIGLPENDGTKGDGNYEDVQGNPIHAPVGFRKVSEVIFKTGLLPGLFSGTGNAIVEEFYFAGNDTLPGIATPGTPDTPEMSNPRMRYKRIVYENPDTNTRITYIFYRNEGALQVPMIDEGTWRIAGAKVTRIQ